MRGDKLFSRAAIIDLTDDARSRWRDRWCVVSLSSLHAFRSPLLAAVVRRGDRSVLHRACRQQAGARLAADCSQYCEAAGTLKQR